MLKMQCVSSAIIIGLLYKNTEIFTTDHIKQWGAEIDSAPHLSYANVCVAIYAFQIVPLYAVSLFLDPTSLGSS
jgi:hypothetical protein